MVDHIISGDLSLEQEALQIITPSVLFYHNTMFLYNNKLLIIYESSLTYARNTNNNNLWPLAGTLFTYALADSGRCGTCEQATSARFLEQRPLAKQDQNGHLATMHSAIFKNKLQ